MKIQSRKESGNPSARYKDHTNTPVTMEYASDLGIQLVAAYTPTSSCPADAVPAYYLSFGMDSRRYVMTLSHAEIIKLKEGVDQKLREIELRGIK